VGECWKHWKKEQREALMPKWRADYFDNRDDEKPSRSEIIDAEDADKASMIAKERSGGWVKVDLTLTVLKDSLSHQNVPQGYVSSAVPSGRPGRGPSVRTRTRRQPKITANRRSRSSGLRRPGAGHPTGGGLFGCLAFAARFCFAHAPAWPAWSDMAFDLLRPRQHHHCHH
jgi:hypothetical protein